MLIYIKKTTTLISQYLILAMNFLSLKYFINVTIDVTTVEAEATCELSLLFF